jgi:N-methylhydantoinase A
VERRQIVGIDERIDRDGEVVKALDLDEVLTKAASLLDDTDVEALAVSFIWSFRNPVHEQMAVEALRRAHPSVVVMAGAELAPVMRESERTMLALLNAYCSGALGGLEALAHDFAQSGATVPMLLVHSGGGMESLEQARRSPLTLAESGPAAGVAGAAAVGSSVSMPDVLTCDMGGTSTDVSVITGGHATRKSRGELMGFWTPVSRVDVESIGAGGGSIAWADARGALRVGPRSAGANPGPACYGRGGTEPTVTDALVVLGYIGADRFLGGDMLLDADAAWSACAALGERLALSTEETAWGIRRLTSEGMVKALRVALRARGCDPRRYALVSYGGCGGLFTADLAQALGSPVMLVPSAASTLSALGAATADLRLERLAPVHVALPGDASKLTQLAGVLAAGVDDDLLLAGVELQGRQVTIEAAVRFRGQTNELDITVPGGVDDADAWSNLTTDFRDEYARRYGAGALSDSATEVVSLRAVGVAATAHADLPALDHGPDRPPTHVGDRLVRVLPDAPVSVPVHDLSGWRDGDEVSGPAILDGADTTIWVPEGSAAVMDERGTIAVTRTEDA